MNAQATIIIPLVITCNKQPLLGVKCAVYICIYRYTQRIYIYTYKHIIYLSYILPYFCWTTVGWIIYLYTKTTWGSQPCKAYSVLCFWSFFGGKQILEAHFQPCLPFLPWIHPIGDTTIFYFHDYGRMSRWLLQLEYLDNNPESIWWI